MQVIIHGNKGLSCLSGTVIRVRLVYQVYKNGKICLSCYTGKYFVYWPYQIHNNGKSYMGQYFVYMVYQVDNNDKTWLLLYR